MAPAAVVANTVVGTTGSATLPAWVSGLATASIKADMTAADVNGSVSYAGLEKVFADLASTLTTGKTTLTSAVFADLKTIAANLNNGMSASAYLTYVTNALVNGNAANATWTAGATKSVALGNLAAGSTAAQVTDLTGKWFLGTDLPNASVLMSGTSAFTVTYSAVSKPLFAATGPSMGDINQGYLGDCYLLSSLAEVASQNPSAISSMITNNGNNTYGVRFYYKGTAEYVTVANTLANGGTEFNNGPDLWASLVEQAYVQFQTIALDTGNSVNYGNAWSTIGNGGVPDYALEAITGASTITDFYSNRSSWGTETYNASLTPTASSAGLTTATVLTALKADLANGYDLVLSSYTNATDSSGRTTLVADHAMSIYGYDSSTGNLEIRNPWGTEAYGQYWDTTFEVSLTTLLSAGDAITVANLSGSNTGIVANALVSAAAGLQASATVTGFTIADTAANVSAGLTALAGDAKLTSIALTDTSKPTIALTSAQFTADTAILAKITSTYSLTVSGALVSTAAVLQASAKVASFTVSDTTTNVTAALSGLSGDTKLTSIVLTDASKPTLSLTAAQYVADTAVLAKIASSHNLTVTGASASAAGGLQAAIGVTSFTVSDTAANVTAARTSLIADTKLSSLAIAGTTGGDTLTLTGSTIGANINLGGDTASASGGLALAKLTFIGTPDAIVLGSGAATIGFTLASSSGIETIANFQYGLDHLAIDLHGAANSILKAIDTTVNGAHAISLYSSGDPSHGVVLMGMPSAATAANLLASHVSFSGGQAMIG